MKCAGKSINRGGIRRLFELDRLIRLGRFTSAQQVADDMEVSRRTIERDLDELRNDLGAELVYDRGKRCYEYAGKPITLPAQWLNEREIAIVLIAERALRIFTSTGFDSEIHPAFNKLLDPIRHDKKMMASILELCNSVHFHRPVEPVRESQGEFSVVLDAALRRRRLAFFYPAKGRLTGEGPVCTGEFWR